MKRVCILLATGLLLLGGSAVRAAEGGGAPGTLILTPGPAAPADSGCAAAGCDAPACDGHCGGHLGRLREWLMYHPPSTRCACHHALNPCMPPLYTFFLDLCPAGGCGACGGHSAPAPAAPCAGACEAPAHP